MQEGRVFSTQKEKENERVQQSFIIIWLASHFNFFYFFIVDRECHSLPGDITQNKQTAQRSI